jgi:hypothetical protein
MSAFLFSGFETITSDAPVVILPAGNYAISDIWFGLNFITTSAATTNTLELELTYTEDAQNFMHYGFSFVTTGASLVTVNQVIQRVFPKELVIPRGSQITLTATNLASPLTNAGIFLSISGYILP